MKALLLAAKNNLPVRWPSKAVELHRRRPWKAIVLLAVTMVMGSVSLLLADVPVLDAVAKQEQDRIAAIEKAARSAVAVFAPGGQGGGSGVVITPDGYCLTNFHVTQPCGEHMKCGMNDSRLYDAVLVGIDPTGDVALIKLLGRNDFPAATLADSDQVKVGDWCFAVGNPFLLATDLQPTVTYGIVSGVHRYQYPAGTLLEYADCIQTDASINPGNSGGPLFNAAGDVIGINGRISIEKRGRVNVGVGYAISINQIKHFMGSLRSGRVVDHATLGATVTTDQDGRVVVSNILPTSDAYRRGLRYGDEIVSFSGRTIQTTNAFKNILGIYPKGWRVPLTYRRDGQRRDLLVRLAGLHANDELLEKVEAKPKKMQPPPPLPKGKKEKDKPDAPSPNKDGDNSERDQPKEKPGPKPRQMPNPHEAEKKPPPPEAAKLIKKRTGFANYYFNELNRDRVWAASQTKGNFAELAGPWTLEGEFTGGGRVRVVLGEKQLTGQFPQGEFAVDTGKDLGEQLGPTGSGGLLVALHLWQRMLVQGPQKFGDVVYQGTFPMLGRDELVDVLIGTHDVVETRFLFDPATGHLVGLEMSPENYADPCEVYFHDFQPLDGRDVPRRLVVRFGNEIFAEINLKLLDLLKAAKKET